MTKTESVGSEIYSGAAGFGRIYALISAIIGTLIAVGMIIGGIYIIQHKSHLKSVDGIVTKSSYDCSTTTEDKNTTTTCKFDVSYTVDKPYNKTFSSTDTFSIGDKVIIWYDPNHPDIGEFNPPSKLLGWLLIGISFLIIFGVWFWVWLTKRSKFAAAAGGASAIINMIRR